MQDWTFQQTISPAETYAVEYKVNGNPSTFASDEVSHVAVSEVTTIYTTIDYYDANGKKQSQDVIASSQSTSTTCVGAANPTRWKSKLEAGSPAFAGAQLTKYSLTTHKYYVTSEGPVEAITVTEEYEPRIAFAGGLAIENYKNIDLGTGNILLRKTIVEKEQNKLADLTKQSTTIYQAWGATSAGKTVASAISGALKKVTNENIRISGTYTLVDRMSVLVCSGTEVSINIGRGLAPAIPSKLDQQNETLRDIQNKLPTNGAGTVNSPVGNPYRFRSTELDFGNDGTNSTDKYDMQFAPDSYLRPSADAGDNGTGLNYVYVSNAAATYEYGRAIYYILSGMANGKSITTELRNLPSEPMGTLYLEAAGTVAKFRANGTTFAFDSQGLIAGCDALLDGGAGLMANATGADWFPMMVPAANLPTVTPTANNSPALANTIAAPAGFDPMAPGNIWASFGTAGVEGDVYAVQLDRPHAVAAATESITRESVSKALTWLLEVPYSLTFTTENLTSVAVSYGTITVVAAQWVTSATTLAPGSRDGGPNANSGVSWVTSLTTLAPGSRNSGIVYGPLVAWVTGSTTLAPGTRSGGLVYGPTVNWATSSTTFAPGTRSGGGGTDPNFSSVGLLLQFGGANNSTAFTDSGPLALSGTTFGNAKISTSGGVFNNGNCGVFDGDGDYVLYPAASVPRFTGDFTIEAWVYPTSSDDMMLASSSSGSDLNVQIIRMNSNGTGTGNLSVYVNGATPISTANGTITANQWQHIALCRSGSNTRIFVDGVQAGSTSTSWTGAFTCNVIGGFFYNGSFLDAKYAGRINEFRTTSVARYTANFTPPSGPF
jgi:hypothetical protein